MSKQGGDLNEMAKEGTSVPGDAGKQNVLPSVLSPHQKRDVGPGATALHAAADNPVGMGPADDEAVTASGHEMPRAATEKNSRSGGKERNQ
ncbi:hypothetical protein F4809DRAFT_6198 [Biscogniauxia mediterranea]|nr:hypothetical protein F4809DRAFT_6198 [Biscogniauxia mediterranea]